MFDRLKDILVEKIPEVSPVKKRMATVVEDDPLDVFSEFENDNPSEQPPTDSTDEARGLHSDPEGDIRGDR